MEPTAMPASPQLRMLRPDLEGLPEVTLPQGYRIRTYQPGDDAHWGRILSESFRDRPEGYSFDEMMRGDPAFRPERIFIACCGDEPVGTTSAWHTPATMPDAGVIHWVAVLPGHTGRRLGYWLALSALHRMVADGRRRSYLNTDDFRLPAIKTYLNSGFQPLLVHENQRERWPKVFAELKLPQLSERFREMLEGPIWEGPERPAGDFDSETRL